MCPSCNFLVGAVRDPDADGFKKSADGHTMGNDGCTHEWPDVFTIPAEFETFHNRVSIACYNRLGMTPTLTSTMMAQVGRYTCDNVNQMVNWYQLL